MTLDLVEPNVIINYIGMEWYFEVDIFIGCNVALLGLDAEQLLAEWQVPMEVGTHVT